MPRGGSDETKFIIEDLTYSGDVSGAYNVGGIAGAFCADYGDEDAVIRNVLTSGTVSATEYGRAGGLAGETCSGLITDSSSGSNVQGEDDVGGLVGENDDTHIYQSYAAGDVSATVGPAGGIVGRNIDDAIIEQSFATGNVVGSERVGGIAGANGGTIVDSYARGGVSGTDQVGSVVGRCGGEVLKTYGTGLVAGDTNTGGFLGSDQGCSITDSFWDTETVGLLSSNGDATGIDTAAMKSLATYTDINSEGLVEPWDFNLVWNIKQAVNDGYPCLQWSAECAPASSQDYNGDSIQDGLQPNVGGYVSPITGKIVAMDMGPGCELTVDDIARESQLSVYDPAYEYTNGLFDFEADCGEVGYTTTVKLYYYDVDPTNLILRKFNPLNNSYFTVNDATIETRVISGQTVVVVTYNITDGGTYDTDGQADGFIKDPAGLALPVVGAPNTGIGGKS